MNSSDYITYIAVMVFITSVFVFVLVGGILAIMAWARKQALKEFRLQGFRLTSW